MIKKTITSYLVFIITFLNLHSSNTYDDNLKEIIINAVWKNKSEEVESLLKNRANPNTVNEDGFALLHLSIFENKLEISELLIKNGANPNVGDSCGDTPLHIASWNRYPDMVKLLLKGGANPNALNNKGANPLHLEIYDASDDPACTEIKNALIAAGSKLDNMKKYGGETTYYDLTKSKSETAPYIHFINPGHIILGGICVIASGNALKYIFILCW